MYEIHWINGKGVPGIKKFDTLYQVADWIHNLYWWGVKASVINIRWVEAHGVQS